MNAKLSYREAAVRGASPVRLVTLLYEQVIEDLGRALAAHGQGNIEGRTREIDHALLVIGHLHSTVDPEQGGQVAANLQRFYAQVRDGLLEAQFRQSTELLEQQISHLMLVREAWEEVERATTAVPIREPVPAGSELNSQVTADWKA